MSVDIALFIHSLEGGGAERVAVLLANEFFRRGLTVELVLQRSTGPYLLDVGPGVRIIDLKSRLRHLPWRFSRYLRSAEPFSVLSFLTAHNVIAAAVVPRSGARLVVCEQNSVVGTKQARGDWQKWLFPLLPFAYRRADSVVAVSQGLSDELVQVGIPAPRLAFIPNPVDPSIARAGASRPPVGDSPTIVAAGRLVEQKDFATLIRAFHQLAHARNARLVVLGEGPLRNDLEELTRQLGIDEMVEMPGFISPPWEVMSKASVVVMSSRWEGWPMVLVEALALGVPVVSTDCPTGPREILDHGRFGSLVPVGDVSAMARAIDRQLSHPPPRAELRARVKPWQVDSIADRYLELLLPELPTNVSSESP